MSISTELRNLIDLTNFTIDENNTNVIKINYEYPNPISTELSAYLVDTILVFKEKLIKGTRIDVLKDNIAYKTIVTDKEIKTIWLSELLGVTRELLTSQVSYSLELDFVYNQTINFQLVTAESQNFTHADIVSLDPVKYSVYELENSNTFTLSANTITSNDFIVDYSDYKNIIKKVTTQLNSGQSVEMEIITDTTVTPNMSYLQISNKDNVQNISIDLIMDYSGCQKYIEVIRDMTRILASTTI